MSKLRERLQDAARSGVYRAGRADEVLDAARGTELAVARIDLRPPVFEAFSKALAFPAWFGRNWDALEDCLTDLSWREAAGHVLLLEGFPESKEEGELLVDVLRSAAEFWSGENKPFFAVFLDPHRKLGLEALFRGA